MADNVKYTVNYDDERFAKVESDKKQALTDLEKTYGGMVDQSDSFFNAQIDASKQWADQQSKNQQAQTDFTIQQVEQQKEQAKKDYTKEQSGAYTDWQKQSAKHGANAEQQASMGMTNTGYSESAQVSMYNTYQNRVMTARETYNLAVQNYNNQITQARLSNSSVLAEIAFNAFQQQLEYSLQGFQYKNNLLLEQANKKVEMENIYHQRYQDVLAQINTENAMAEDIRQYEKNYAFQEKQFAEEIRQFQENMAFQEAEKQKDREHDSAEAVLDRQHSSKLAELERKFKADQAVLDRKHDKEILAAKNKHDKEMADKAHEQALAKLAKQHEYDKKLMAQELSDAKAKLKYQYDLEAKAKKATTSGGNVSTKKTYQNKMSGVGGSVNKATGKVTGDSDTSGNYERAKEYYNGMVAAGKSKSQVLSDITSAYKSGNLSKSDYDKLRSIFNAKGVEY